jgi:hypothetical protein
MMLATGEEFFILQLNSSAVERVISGESSCGRALITIRNVKGNKTLIFRHLVIVKKLMEFMVFPLHLSHLVFHVIRFI